MSVAAQMITLVLESQSTRRIGWGWMWQSEERVEKVGEKNKKGRKVPV